jgi:hypothetical protein
MSLPPFPFFKPTRRDVLKAAGVGAAWAVFPGACKKAPTPYQLKFFSATEADAIGALADFILPPDSQLPGGKLLGAVEYIDSFLASFNGGGPIYAGGPYSGRQPYPNPDGTPSKNFPPDDFSTALALDRISTVNFQLMISGPSAVPGGLPNASVVSPLADWQSFIRTNLATVIAASTTPLSSLTSKQLGNLYNSTPAFQTLLYGPTTLVNGGYTPTGSGIIAPGLIELVCEAAFAPPEYGGNTNLGGWQIANFEGDSQPMGFSWYDTTTNSYQENPNAPVSSPNPGMDPAPIDATTTKVLDFIITLPAAFTNGQKFF